MLILVTGGSGLLGSKLVKIARSQGHEVVPTHLTKPLFPESNKFDITDRDAVFRTIAKLEPDVVVHTAAETNVDRCEVEKERAWRINVEGTRNMAEVCAKIDCKLVYISTDYVFDGRQGAYREDDPPNPVNYYGLTKLEGERAVERACSDFLIVRSSVLYGWHPWKPNFAKWTVESLEAGRRIRVVSDHYNSPTLADNLAEALLEGIERDLRGVCHMAGAQRISRYDFAVAIAEEFGLDLDSIEPISMNELDVWIAKRPCDSSLRIEKAQRALKAKLLGVAEGLRALKELSRE